MSRACRPAGTPPGPSGPQIYVTGQDLVYNSVVVTSIQGRPYRTTEELNAPEPTAPLNDKTAEKRLRELESLYKQALISEEEYQRKRAEIIESL